MKKILVTYYSGTGSNRYLAERFAKNLNADIEEIRPKIAGRPWLVFLGLLNLGASLKKMKHQPADYDAVVLCGPIWMGKLISPLKGFINTYSSQINELYFATNCGGDDEMKDDNFGYASVFEKVRNAAKSPKVSCEAFPIPLVIPEEKKEDNEFVMKTRLNDQNFTGEILDRFNRFTDLIMASDSAAKVLV